MFIATRRSHDPSSGGAKCDSLDNISLVRSLLLAVEHTNPQAVFDGDLDVFMEAYLRWRRTNQ